MSPEQIEAVRADVQKLRNGLLYPWQHDEVQDRIHAALDHLAKANEELRAEVERLKSGDSHRNLNLQVSDLRATITRLTEQCDNSDAAFAAKDALIDRLTKERDEARRVLYAEVVRHSRELDTIRALVDGAIRRAGGTPKLTADYVAEPLRNLTKPEPEVDPQPEPSTLPPGYGWLPDGMRCRCIKLWQDGKGNYACCRGYAGVAQSSRGGRVVFDGRDG